MSNENTKYIDVTWRNFKPARRPRKAHAYFTDGPDRPACGAKLPIAKTTSQDDDRCAFDRCEICERSLNSNKRARLQAGVASAPVMSPQLNASDVQDVIIEEL